MPPKLKLKPNHHSRSPLPQSFTTKKSHILSSISTPQETYTDNSPKGTIDTPILDLIEEINEIEGLVTTSSCSGRVAVFVEGRGGRGDANAGVGDGDEGDDGEVKAVVGGPGGKGGGRWLFVSHERVELERWKEGQGDWMEVCGLRRTASGSITTAMDESLMTKKKEGNSNGGSGVVNHSPPRLVKLMFSPLILHVLAASLAHAKPLLAAAINAGFRESGVQSLKALDDPEAGVMVGIRTSGVGFETVVGVVREGENGEEVCEAVVGEEYLDMVFRVVHERFVWNERRRERFREEMRRAFGEKGEGEWEEKEVRARRLREEGLKRREEVRERERVGVEEEGSSVLSLGGEDSMVGMFNEDTNS